MAVELTTKALWAALGIAVIYLATSLGVGQIDAPGPGLMSMLVGILMTLVAAGSFILQLVNRTEIAYEPWPASALVRIGGLIVLLILYIAFLEKIGFVIDTFALLVILFAVFSRIRWHWSLLLAAVISGANYALFKLVLGTQLPAGIFG
jgi:putative tricarboxylic transport membrane protein